MTKIILFDEQAKDLLPGINGDYSFIDMPVWGNLRFRFFINTIISNYKSKGFEVIVVKWENLADLNKRLRKEMVNRCFVSRISSFAWADLEHFKSPEEGPVKLSINRTPTDLYYLIGNSFSDFFDAIDGGDIYNVETLFNDYLFNNFIRIINQNGYPFLMRDPYEYYRENMRILKYINDERFLSVLKICPTLSEAETYVGGSVEGSYLGSGSNVMGIVKNSIIFEGVEVDEGSYIESSVVLPGNKLEKGVIIKNSLLLKGEGRIVGQNTRIGGFDYNIKGIKHSTHLKNGLTVIGENLDIPENSEIGTHCVVVGKGQPKERILLRNGEYLSIDFD